MTPTPISVLLCDDDPVDVFIVTRAIERSNAPISLNVTSDGDEAIRYLKSCEPNGVNQRPQVILLDLRMPRKTGFEVLDFIKSEPALRQIPVIVLSASSNLNDIEQSYQRQAAAYIQKPDKPEEMTDIIRSLAQLWTNYVNLPMARASE